MADRPLTDVPVLILGESHSTAISRAIDASGETGFIAIDVRKDSDDSKINFDLFNCYRPEHLVLAFGGTEHNIVGMMEGEPKFDFLWPPYEDFDADRTFMTASAIEELLHHRMQSGVKRALRAAAGFDCPLYAVAPPPPFLEIDDQTAFPRAFSAVLEAGIAPAPIRRKIYAMQCEMMKALYAEHGIRFLGAPPKAFDEDGFLQRSLWGREPTHGNRRYGQVLIAYLKRKLGLDAGVAGKKADA